MRKGNFIGLLLLAFCAACRFFRPVADFYSQTLYPVISGGLSALSSVIPFSFEEIVVLAFAAILIGILVRTIVRKEKFGRWLGKTLVVLMWLVVWFYMGWGNNYHRTGLYERNGIKTVAYDEDAFKGFLATYTANLNALAVESDTYDQARFEDEVKAFYTEVASNYGYAPLRRWQHVKKPLINRLFSAVGVQGYMGPFLAESQVNGDVTCVEYPYVAAHELSHLAGVTSEAEASYWGFACCRQSADAPVRYSGYLCLLPYVSQQAKALLPAEDYAAWMTTVSDKPKADLAASREIWQAKRVGWIENIQRWMQNLLLKGNGVSEGTKDYFGVVSMLMTMDAREAKSLSLQGETDSVYRE